VSAAAKEQIESPYPLQPSQLPIGLSALGQLVSAKGTPAFLCKVSCPEPKQLVAAAGTAGHLRQQAAEDGTDWDQQLPNWVASQLHRGHQHQTTGARPIVPWQPQNTLIHPPTSQ